MSAQDTTNHDEEIRSWSDEELKRRAECAKKEMQSASGYFDYLCRELERRRIEGKK